MKIKVKGSNLEMLDIEVNEEQVQEMWNTNYEQLEQIKQLTENLDRKTSNLKYKSEEIDRLEFQIREANILLTKLEFQIREANILLNMLGVAEKDISEKIYNKSRLSLSSRIALYIAGKLNV